MKFKKKFIFIKLNIYIQKTALFIAVEIGNTEIVKCLLLHPKINVNAKSIFN